MDLRELGILEQQCSDLGKLLTPNDFSDIRTALEKERGDYPSLEDYASYSREMWESWWKPETKEKLFDLVFGTSHEECVNTKSENIMTYDMEWSSYEPFRDDLHPNILWNLHEQKPRPDYAEGIRQIALDETILNSHPLIVVTKTMALPNFFVEFKLESTFDAHAQNRHNGAIATRAWMDLIEHICRIPTLEEDPLEVTQAGSVEFNGDTLTANIHWASKLRSQRLLKKPEYHMVRVIFRTVIGLSYDDFISTMKEARNFRQYFADRRDRAIQAIVEARKRKKTGGSRSRKRARIRR